MKKVLFLCILIFVLAGFAACGGDDTPTAHPVFGAVQTISITNPLGQVVIESAYVIVDYGSFTDEDLIDFFHSYINGSGFNWFTIKFGDGTGYVFPGSRNRFGHRALDGDGAGIRPVGYSGFIWDEHIDWLSPD